jgi:hypothetical protein
MHKHKLVTKELALNSGRFRYFSSCLFHRGETLKTKQYISEGGMAAVPNFKPMARHARANWPTLAFGGRAAFSPRL